MKTQMQLNANTDHQTASEWYDSYGAHTYSEARDCDIPLQAVESEWLADGLDDDEIIEMLGDAGIRGDDARECLRLARRIWAAAVEVEEALAAAVEAYADGDLDAVLDALDCASGLEKDHGDDPATAELRLKLLEESAE
jgi:hypothetical protein